MMVRLFVLFPFLAFTPHRDRCPIIAVNDAACGPFSFFELGHLAYILGVGGAAERIGACPR